MSRCPDFDEQIPDIDEQMSQKSDEQISDDQVLHNRSIPTGQLLCSFTEAIRVASPFGTNCSCCLCWLNLELVLVALCYFVVGKIGTDTGGALWWLTFECMLLVPNKSSSVSS